jgi:hypothetical protein
MLVYNASIAATSLCAVWARLTSLRRSFGLGRAEAPLQERAKHDVNIDVSRPGMAKGAR